MRDLHEIDAAPKPGDAGEPRLAVILEIAQLEEGHAVGVPPRDQGRVVDRGARARAAPRAVPHNEAHPTDAHRGAGGRRRRRDARGPQRRHCAVAASAPGRGRDPSPIDVECREHLADRAVVVRVGVSEDEERHRGDRVRAEAVEPGRAARPHVDHDRLALSRAEKYGVALPDVAHRDPPVGRRAPCGGDEGEAKRRRGRDDGQHGDGGRYPRPPHDPPSARCRDERGRGGRREGRTQGAGRPREPREGGAGESPRRPGDRPRGKAGRGGEQVAQRGGRGRHEHAHQAHDRGDRGARHRYQVRGHGIRAEPGVE